MASQFRNLVFEGGGVKGIAYVGAMEELEKRGVVKDIKRYGGTSAGAINATLCALGFDNATQLEIMKKMNFNDFMDDTWFIPNLIRVHNEFGWHKGDFFRQWIGDFIAEKLGSRDASFQDLKDKGCPDLYVYGTNLSTRFGEVFSQEHTPDTSIADAVRISMAIPLFFTAVRTDDNSVYVDGGALNNYPVKLFDRERYITSDAPEGTGEMREYYVEENKKFLKQHPDSSPYTFNKQTLGFRLDTASEIAPFRRKGEPQKHEIDCFPQYVKGLIKTILDSQNNQHIHGDDWHRTVYIDTLDVQTTEFDITKERQDLLIAEGRKGVTKYFEWFDNPIEEFEDPTKIPKNKVLV